MTWIVLKEENGKIKMVSKAGTPGMVPKGAYLTINDQGCKFILRVDDSGQWEPFEPSPLIADIGLQGITADRGCKNIISAYRVRTIDTSDDDYIRYIRPQSEAVRSTQEEVDLAMGTHDVGPEVFVATIFANENRILRDDQKKMITAHIPEDFYFYQTMICGKTGSGKTVAMKYLAQYFIEKMGGAVLAINVKEADFLGMDRPSETKNENSIKEWNELGGDAKGIDAFTVYHPANHYPDYYRNLSADLIPITLNVDKIEPDALIGVLTGITDRAAMSLPGIFNKWRYDQRNKKGKIRYNDFLTYVANNSETKKFETRNELGDESVIQLHPGTYQSIINCLSSASIYFDNEKAKMLDFDDILDAGKMSVIDVVDNTQFGSLILRDLLKRLVKAKNDGKSDVKLLLIIDEVHQFYSDGTSRDALGDLDSICRTGRSKKIGVIFASQNPADMPSGLSSVVNSKIYFKTDSHSIKEIGTKISIDELNGLKSGFAIASIHDLSQLSVLKFPLSFSGVIDR